MTTNQHLATQIRQGFTLLEMLIVVSLVGILAAVALQKLLWYQGQAEKSAMEYTATMIKSALWMESANLMMANRGNEVVALAERNPINLLAEKPANYLGEVDSDNIEELANGNWVYDVRHRQLSYLVSHKTYFKPKQGGNYLVRYKIHVLYGEIEITYGKHEKYVAGVTLKLQSGYDWQ